MDNGLHPNRNGLFKLIDSKYGVVTKIEKGYRPPGEPLCFLYHCFLTHENHAGRETGSPLVSSGAGLHQGDAMKAALGEAAERHCAYFPELKKFPLASWKEIGPDALSPQELPGYLPFQYKEKNFPYSPFTPKTKIRWVKGYSLVKTKVAWVPAQYVYVYLYPHAVDAEAEEAMVYGNTTTGLACGSSMEEAVLAGIYEVVERDSFSVAWLNRLSMPTLDTNKIGKTHPFRKILLERFIRPHLRFRIIEMTTDLGIPTYCVVIRQIRGKGPLMTTGAASHLDSITAIQKGLLEASVVRFWMVRSMEEWRSKTKGLTGLEAFKQVANFGDHGMLYANSRFNSYASFLDSASPSRTLDTLPGLSYGNAKKDLQYCMSILEKKGYDVILVDVTKDEVARAGLHVVKVIIPGLQPLHAGWRKEVLRNRRLYEIPWQLGYSRHPKRVDEINRVPHPFP